jgi:hypothetical protein
MSSPSAGLGLARPRTRLAPRARRSDADDAIFLASGYGLTPDPWQADVLDDWLGRAAGGRWAAATCGLAVARQNGKNGVIEVRELFGMVALGERFLHTAHEVKTARKAFLRIASFFENERKHPELAALVKDIRKTNGQEAVVLVNGGSVEFVARSKGSGRGFTVDVLVLDEAQDLTDEELEALLPTISAAPLGNPQVILTGTPPNPEKHQTGEVFTRVRADGENGADHHLAWTDFGVVDGPLPDVDDRDLWRRTNPALGGRLNIAEVERERKLMSREGFARERLGWWGDPAAHGEATVVDMDQWAKLASPTAIPSGPVALAVAVPRDRSSTSVAVSWLGDDARVMSAVTRLPGTAKAVETIRRLADAHNVVDVSLHAGGPAGALVADLEAEGVEVTTVSTTEMAQATGAYRDGIKNAAVGHVDQHDLTEPLRAARLRPAGDGEMWDQRDDLQDISAVIAVTLSTQGFVKHAPDDYDVLDSIY